MPQGDHEVHKTDHEETTADPGSADGWRSLTVKMTTALISRPQQQRLRVSVVVPCSHKHAHLLTDLCQELYRQSRSPDEIVVASSGPAVPQLPSEVRVLHSAAPCTTGRNRNRGFDAIVGDLVVFQDADDLPHPQRVEIVAGLFEGYEIEHLMHGYVYTRGKGWSVGFPNASNQRELPIELPPSSVAEAAKKSHYRTERAHSTQVSNGEVAVLRSVYAAVRWPERPGIGTDQEFNQLVYQRFKRTVTTPLALVVYRHDLSSFR